MALSANDFLYLKKSILKEAIDSKSNVLIYFYEWIFELPSNDLLVNGESIIQKYEIPTGWDGFGLFDLDKLESEGFIIKINELENDPVTLEKIIKYQIVDSVVI